MQNLLAFGITGARSLHFVAAEWPKFGPPSTPEPMPKLMEAIRETRLLVRETALILGAPRRHGRPDPERPLNSGNSLRDPDRPTGIQLFVLGDVALWILVHGLNASDVGYINPNYG
jgi:hypothetical protein